MSIGTGIAIAAVWGCTVFVCKDERVTGIGMAMMLVIALLATGAIASAGK